MVWEMRSINLLGVPIEGGSLVKRIAWMVLSPCSASRSIRPSSDQVAAFCWEGGEGRRTLLDKCVHLGETS